jgi:hypothetical protein
MNPLPSLQVVQTDQYLVSIEVELVGREGYLAMEQIPREVVSERGVS